MAGTVRITDFAPRFQNYGRIFRPPQLVRIIEPIAGMPRITIRFRTAHRYGVPVATRSSGSNHIRYWRDDVPVRLTTDAPLSYVENEAVLRAHAPGAPGVRHGRAVRGFARNHLPGILRPHARLLDGMGAPARLLGRLAGRDHPRRDHAQAVQFRGNRRDRGGAHHLDPGRAGIGRNWDYRYCWMRDAFFVVRALNRIGATRTMEQFISYILSIAADRADRLKPLYGVVHTDTLEERTAEALAGFNGDGPVRIGNAAVHQDQHDVYGSIIMAATPMFFDRRLPKPGDAALFKVLEPLGEQAARLALEPDAGIWEYRGRKRVHTYSAAMCWAGCHRLEAIAHHLGLAERAAYWGDIAKRIGEEVLQACLESEAQGLCGGIRQRRPRRQLPAAGRARADRARRSAFRVHRGGDRP